MNRSQNSRILMYDPSPVGGKQIKKKKKKDQKSLTIITVIIN